MTNEIATMIRIHVSEPECRLTAGALLDLIMDTFGATRNKAREMKKAWMIELYGTPSAVKIAKG